VDYGSFERSLCEKRNEVERRAHEAALTALDINAPAVLVGGRRYTRVLEDVVATFMSQAGGIPVSRTAPAASITLRPWIWWHCEQ